MRATVLWTGGKDSALAFHKARLAGYEIVNLLTFVPEKADFLAHPLPFIKYQAEAIGMPHHEVVIEAPVEGGYEKAIRAFKDKHKIDAFITGDIAEVNGLPNWIRERCRNSGVDVLTPLWGANRREVFMELLSSGFKVIISCVKTGCLDEEWLGRELDKKALSELIAIGNKTGLDICGEQGEYHTLALDGPI
ncbi:MAG: diphthine--ammonia ligase, partial [Candidatus Omnitrophica bacterium]|nr:diphthine--ammonia ligase [Candidatus Omnitrophota bacterium]